MSSPFNDPFIVETRDLLRNIETTRVQCMEKICSTFVRNMKKFVEDAKVEMTRMGMLIDTIRDFKLHGQFGITLSIKEGGMNDRVLTVTHQENYKFFHEVNVFNIKVSETTVDHDINPKAPRSYYIEYDTKVLGSDGKLEHIKTYLSESDFEKDPAQEFSRLEDVKPGQYGLVNLGLKLSEHDKRLEDTILKFGVVYREIANYLSYIINDVALKTLSEYSQDSIKKGTQS